MPERSRHSLRQDTFSHAERSEIMRRVRSRDTVPERRLRLALWHEGFRYRIDYQRAPGRPDIAMVGRKVAVFVDGEFWHGKKLSARRLSEMSEYWRRKIRRNMKRDKNTNKALLEDGWRVIRVTDRAVSRNLEKIVGAINRVLAGRRVRNLPDGLEVMKP